MNTLQKSSDPQRPATGACDNLDSNKPLPRPPALDARLRTAAAFVRRGHIAADIGCDHGKLAAYLVGSGHCPRVIATDLRPGPLAKAAATCKPWADQVDLRLGDGLSALRPGEATDFIIAGMGAQTICGILDETPWVKDPALRWILVPATKHSLLRRWLARQGFITQAETLCHASGRYYTVLQAQWGAQPQEPTGLMCICGKLQGQAGCREYRLQQYGKLKKYRLGLPEQSAEAAGVDALLRELEGETWP